VATALTGPASDDTTHRAGPYSMENAVSEG
jgi:hypothetical protein